MTVVCSTTCNKACVEADKSALDPREDVVTSSLKLIGTFNNPTKSFSETSKCHLMPHEMSLSVARGSLGPLLFRRQDQEGQCATFKLHDSARSLNYASPFGSGSCVSDLEDAGKGSSSDMRTSNVAISLGDAKMCVKTCTKDPLNGKRADDALRPGAFYPRDFSLEIPPVLIVISAIVLLSNFITGLASPASTVLIYVAIGSVLPIIFTTAEAPNHRQGSISIYSAIISLLSYITLGAFLHGGCLDAEMVSEGTTLATTVEMLMHAVHAIAARPALYTTGLPQDSFSLPQTVAGQQWLLAMYFIAIFGFILPFTWLKWIIAGTRPAGPSHNTSSPPSSSSMNQRSHNSDGMHAPRMTPAMLPYVAVCAASSAWIALATLACWIA